MLTKLFKASVIFLSLFVLTSGAQATTLDVSLAGDTFSVDDTFDVNILIDSQGASINAVQTTLRFPANFLQVSSVKKTNSVFDLWLTEPTYSNTNGTLSFVAGSANGFSGPSLNALTVTFQAKVLEVLI